MSTNVNTRAIGVEERWFPFNSRQRGELRGQLVAAGTPRSAVAGILEFVEAQSLGDVGAFPVSSTRARYRRILAELVGVDPDGDQRPGLPLGWRTSEAGYAELVGAGLVGVVAMAIWAIVAGYAPDLGQVTQLSLYRTLSDGDEGSVNLPMAA